jgi:hypothetical protein
MRNIYRQNGYVILRKTYKEHFSRQEVIRITVMELVITLMCVYHPL